MIINCYDFYYVFYEKMGDQATPQFFSSSLGPLIEDTLKIIRTQSLKISDKQFWTPQFSLDLFLFWYQMEYFQSSFSTQVFQLTIDQPSHRSSDRSTIKARHIAEFHKKLISTYLCFKSTIQSHTILPIHNSSLYSMVLNRDVLFYFNAAMPILHIHFSIYF